MSAFYLPLYIGSFAITHIRAYVSLNLSVYYKKY